jgi:hypothetical protein
MLRVSWRSLINASELVGARVAPNWTNAGAASDAVIATISITVAISQRVKPLRVLI